MTSTISFQFSDEKLRVKPPRSVAPTGGMLDNGALGTRISSLTSVRQEDVTWSPNEEHSVINVFASSFPCFCCGRWTRFGCTRATSVAGLRCYALTLTRAQWIWLLNLAALVVHSIFAYMAFNSCNTTRFGVVVNPNCTAAGMSVPVYRLQTNWTATQADGYAVSLIDNQQPIRFDYLTGSFFLASAIAHAFVVLVGPFDRFAWAYWKQLDSAFSWWRWAEYSISASIMALAIFLLSGVREQNTLVFVFLLMWCVQAFGLFTEMYSRPDKRQADGYRGWEGDPIRTEKILTIKAKRDAWRNRGNGKRVRASSTELESQGLNGPFPLTLAEEECLRAYTNAYFTNYLRRVVPHILGYVPYIGISFRWRSSAPSSSSQALAWSKLGGNTFYQISTTKPRLRTSYSASSPRSFWVGSCSSTSSCSRPWARRSPTPQRREREWLLRICGLI